jgi:hypothetical protein
MTMKEVIEHLERMAETLDGVTEENWLDTPEDIAQIYRSVANEIKQKMSAQNKSVTNCNQLKIREACQKMIDILMSHGNGRTHCILTWDEFNDAYMMIRNALSAPPRNCDIQSVIDDSHSAWLADKDNWDELGDPKKEIHEWLLAEAEGEAKCR